MTNYQAVMFDLDGTLLDTIDDLGDSMNWALAQLGLATHGIEECKYFVGDGVRNFALRALPEDRRDEATLAQLIGLYRDAYSRNWDRKTRPYEGIAELLDELTRRGLDSVVYSNKPDEFTNLAVKKILGRWEFRAIVGARQGVPHKPDPGAALEIARQLNIPPQQFIYLGDTNTDMQTANAAGMYAVGALWGFRTAEELRANNAKALIAHPLDLVKLL